MHEEITSKTEARDTLEADIAGLLNDLSAVQRDLLDVLTQKRGSLAAGDSEALPAISVREQDLVRRLQACHDRRQQLLAQAADDGLPSDSIRSLSKTLPSISRNRLRGGFDEAQQRSRLLQHECLTNWVLVQRTLLHLSQLIEIIATGGRMQPTYGKGLDRQGQPGEPLVGGALVDRAV
jgi:hypothetical protein